MGWMKSADSRGWSCSGILSYREHPCLDCSFSEDGSIIAAAFGNNVCLYQVDDFDNVVLLTSHIEKLRFVQFGEGSCGHLLLVASKNHLQCWDILTGDLLWSTDVHVKLLVADQFTENVAVFTKRQCHVFRPSSEIPLFSSDVTMNFTGAGFFPNRGETSSISCFEKSVLYMVSNEMTVYTFASADELVNDRLTRRTASSSERLQTL